MIRVRVPATSANMGAGFDSLGTALSLYNFIEVSKIPSGLEITENIRTPFAIANNDNLIYRAIKRVFEAADYTPDHGLKIHQHANIPMTRGLGSSSACIVGGMVAANIISGRKFTYQELLALAADMEGHPDNVTPAFFGGICASATEGDRVDYVSVKLKPKYKYAVMVPDFFTATKKARKTLPDKVPHTDAAHNVSRAVLFALGIAAGKTEVLKPGVDDRLHQPYRKAYIDGFDEIFARTYEAGAAATYLSGSGPTIVSILDKNAAEFKKEMDKFFLTNSHEWTCRIYSPDNVGVVTALYGDARNY